ncbi:MAG: hypothetical protein R2911_37360 [Caldilineaceae bacterium]
MDLQGWGPSIVTTGYGNLFPAAVRQPERGESVVHVRLWRHVRRIAVVAAAAAIVQRTTGIDHGGTPGTPAQIKQVCATHQYRTDWARQHRSAAQLRAAILNVLGNRKCSPVTPPTITPASGFPIRCPSR